MFGAAWPGCTEDGQPPDKGPGNERLYSVHTKLCAPGIVDEETGSEKMAETLDQWPELAATIFLVPFERAAACR